MAGCTIENWSLKDLATALTDKHKDNKVLVVPMFQRGRRWQKDQEIAFIDSLRRGFPVGTMLFYKTVDANREVYTLVDGLQRGSTIRKYMNNPTQFFIIDNIPGQALFTICKILNEEYITDTKKEISKIILEFIRKSSSFDDMQYFDIATNILAAYSQESIDKCKKIIAVLKPFVQKLKGEYEIVSSTIIPVIVYSGDENYLPEIFDRINSKGTPLSPYEVYAASWPVNERFTVNNKDIVENVMKKYDLLTDDDYKVDNYDRESMRKNKQLNIFEYVFGFSRYLNEKYDFLHFDYSKAADEINPMGFELINACLNDNKDSIKTLYRQLAKLDINLFEERLREAITFVSKIIKKITMFKGNSRTGRILLHSKYQILSMISATFKEMYDINDLSVKKKSWQEHSKLLSKNMLSHYVHDILSKEWSFGGTDKIHTAAKQGKYLKVIPFSIWENTLNGYFEQSIIRQETKSVAGPKKEDITLLNCIYLPVFSALDQLSEDYFDVEHIATKDLMKKLIADSHSMGLPISSIANLCYLPESINRSKGAKTFYQDNKYRSKVDLKEIEKKYSFTVEGDLDWIELPYKKGDSEALKEYYLSFLRKRFKKQKEMLYSSLSINIEDYDLDIPENENIDSSGNGEEEIPFNSTVDECIKIVEEKLHRNFKNMSKRLFISEDGTTGVVLMTSKTYWQGNRKKYWFGYRNGYENKLKGCKKIYIAYACGNASRQLLMSSDTMENIKHKLRFTNEKSGKIHWHVVFFEDEQGNFSWLYSNPKPTEINATGYLI